MGGQEFHGGDAVKIEPVSAVSGHGHYMVAVAHVLARKGIGAVGEGDVIDSEALVGTERGGDE